jgi:uracil-DNA glycosylase
MIVREASEPYKPQQRPEPDMKRKAKPADDIEELREEAASCRACPLWKNATQTVFGEGPSHAPIMLVGEQPGDKEDLAGHPFVGPAGGMLDRALAEAGIDRDKVYVTNAVKHFKNEPRGKRRLHKRPNQYEIDRCRWWLDLELTAVRPKLVVALGVTAARTLMGRNIVLVRERGRLLSFGDGQPAMATIHPSAILRAPDEAGRRDAYRGLVRDLKLAVKALAKLAA